MNTILYSVMNFVNPGYISLWWTRRKYRKDASKWAVTQDEANKLWENPTFRIDTISANMINVLQIAAFFSPLIPLSLVFTLIFFISNYWIYKVITIFF